MSANLNQEKPRCGLLHKPIYEITFDLGDGIRETILVCKNCYSKPEWHNHIVILKEISEEEV